jgi:Melibiase
MTKLVLPLFCLHALSAAGPVEVRTSASAIVLANDYLERTISIAGGDVGTRHLLNKITGRGYSLRGSEFEVKLNYERVGYSFGSENPRAFTAAGVRVDSRSVEDTPAGGKRLTLHLAPSRGVSIDLVYELNPADFFTRQWIRLAKPQQGTLFLEWVAPASNEWGVPRFTLGGFGQPLFAEDLFLGLEYPTGFNTASSSEVTLGGNVGMNIPDGGYTSEPAVIGVAPTGRVHEQFLEYVARMRVAPVRPYLLYNSWYDLQRLAMNRDNTLERVPTFQKLLLQKYGLHLDSFVLDDGWDDMHKLWAIDQQRFPNGFRDLAAALKTIDSHLGIWFGPIGGYDQRPVRIATGKADGMEVTSDGRYFCVAGKNYSRLLTDTMLKYQKDYGINYFKLDGVAFGCNEPNHGHPQGVYSDEATARTFIDMLGKLRAQDPQVFLNITTSIWLSPWWLRFADTVWMGGADSGYLPTVPTLAPRQSAVSYRDSVLYDDFVTHKAQFPINSLMTHGIIKGKANMLGGEKESIEDWRDEVVHYYSVGNMMYELYISPEILSAEEMDVLGNVTKWATANAHPLLDNSTMVLGAPAKREPYGYVHSIPAKSIVTLRNPFVRPQTVKLKVDEENGFRKFEGGQVLEVQYPYRKIEAAGVRFGDNLTFDLGSYEQIVAELHPGANATLPTHERAKPTGITFSPATLRNEAGGIQVSTTVQVPTDYREARFAVLLEPEQETRNIKADALNGGRPLALSTENGGRGIWYWFWANLAPGDHSVDLTVHSSGPAHISAWLLTRRDVGNPPNVSGPANLLPAQSNIVRGTQLLLEETIR